MDSYLVGYSPGTCQGFFHEQFTGDRVVGWTNCVRVSDWLARIVLIGQIFYGSNSKCVYKVKKMKKRNVRGGFYGSRGFVTLVKDLQRLSRNTETRFGEENERLALERDTIVFGWT